jgi:hypothetical protein
MPPCCPRVFTAAVFCLLLLGCEAQSGLDVSEGQYHLVVHGALADTLTGPAVIRAARNGRLGIELGPQDGPGLSLEIARPSRSQNDAASPIRPGRYEVVAAELLDAPRPDSLSGLLAFLSVANRTFAATQGHLSVTDTDDGTVGGTLSLVMDERDSALAAARTVQVTGTLRATRP